MEFGRPSINPQESGGTIITSEVVLSDPGDSHRFEWGRADGGLCDDYCT